MPMFILQVLTLVFGIISVISNRGILSFATIYLSLTVQALRIYTINTLFGMYRFGLKNYGQGYYFGYYSVDLFLSAFVVNEVTNAPNKYKITDPSHGDAK
jgi:hypothetical protein